MMIQGIMIFFGKLNWPEKEGFPTLASPIAVGDALPCDQHDANDDYHRDENCDGHDDDDEAEEDNACDTNSNDYYN